MNDGAQIEMMISTAPIFPTPPGVYHYKKMPMRDAFAIEKALLEEGDFFGPIFRAIHPDKDYPEPNPNPYYTNIDPHQALVGFRFVVNGTEDIRTAYDVVYACLEKSGVPIDDYLVGEVGVSRMNKPRENRYHPKFNPKAEL